MDMPPWIIRVLAGFISRWALKHESRILDTGRCLDEKELNWARQLGIQKPQLIRIRLVKKIPVPLPDFWFSDSLIQRFALRSCDIAGLTLGYGIYVRQNEENGLLIAHELAHVEQYERLGGIKAFLSTYLFDCFLHGYLGSKIEKEAIEKSVSLVNPTSLFVQQKNRLRTASS